jgi:quercetin dioxygenase-like cupin family protein
MTAGRSLRSVAWLLTLVVGVGIGTAIGQQSPPKDNKGLAAKVASTVDLAPNMPGYQLRLRTITVAPAGVVGLHSHKDRPEVVYILEGMLTELKEGGYTQEYRPGRCNHRVA